MGENVARGVGGIARNDERIEQHVITENDEHEREQTRDPCDFRGGALGIVDLIVCHVIFPLLSRVHQSKLITIFPRTWPCWR